MIDREVMRDMSHHPSTYLHKDSTVTIWVYEKNKPTNKRNLLMGKHKFRHRKQIKELINIPCIPADTAKGQNNALGNTQQPIEESRSRQ